MTGRNDWWRTALFRGTGITPAQRLGFVLLILGVLVFFVYGLPHWWSMSDVGRDFERSMPWYDRNDARRWPGRLIYLGLFLRFAADRFWTWVRTGRP